ncbi:MAG: acetolactate decarboxylase [Candidatus Nanopelagicales bacterium]|nr:acetolactate decarboxylase [Candidatus Nanopelagicales bacterium]MCF8536873.1 acetolactate decarboxylase [Candidatus Nanopelagicales bacterium]MCF8542351.1 acetolactate decarboxylase [Candidatus Nanopelagicales bacterium]MCF8557642.1 acetolactate decarboxylase [Candidatus Nanopelagicales bacterium]
MNPRLFASAGAVALVVTLAPLSQAGASESETKATISQVGTYDYLVQPDFAGLAPLSEVIEGQTLGLGTFADLDGEFVMVAGVPYQVRPDGTPREVDPQVSTPFAQAVDFRPDTSGPVAPGTTCADLGPVITALAGSDDGITAVRVRGTFTDLVTRSVPRQQVPYPSLAQVVAGQTVFALGQERAVLVGFWQGDDMKGVGQPGLHLHGVNVDRSAGGHVLSCVVGSDVQVSVQRTAGVTIHSRH